MTAIGARGCRLDSYHPGFKSCCTISRYVGQRAFTGQNLNVSICRKGGRRPSLLRAAGKGEEMAWVCRNSVPCGDFGCNSETHSGPPRTWTPPLGFGVVRSPEGKGVLMEQKVGRAQGQGSVGCGAELCPDSCCLVDSVVVICDMDTMKWGH